MNAAIEITDLVKRYGGSRRHGHEGKEALKGVSLEVPRGSIFGLLGPNGAGKSTLINILAGLVNKTSGSIIIDGKDLDVDARATRYSLGVVPQEVVLDPFFPVAEMLEHYAGYYGVKKSERRTQELLKALHLEDKANVGSRRLSGGMKRRVLIAKALVHNPPILVLDEPTAGVDVELRDQLWEYVQELNARGTTIILTTHYLEEAENLCDKIAIINHGEIVANDDTSSLLQSVGSKQVTLEFTKPLKTIPKALSSFKPTKVNDNTLQLHVCSKDSDIDPVFKAVANAKLTLKDVTTAEADLEDVFKELVSA